MWSCLRRNTGNGNDSRLLFFCLIRMTTGLFKKQEDINAVGIRREDAGMMSAC